MEPPIIDWDKPIIAVPSKKNKRNKILNVSIDKTYFRPKDKVPIKFDCNLWVKLEKQAPGGTWYFDHYGNAISGLSPEGYDALYYIRNKEI